MIGAARTIQNTKRDRFYLSILMNQVLWWEEEAVSQAVLPYISVDYVSILPAWLHKGGRVFCNLLFKGKYKGWPLTSGPMCNEECDAMEEVQFLSSPQHDIGWLTDFARWSHVFLRTNGSKASNPEIPGSLASFHRGNRLNRDLP